MNVLVLGGEQELTNINHILKRNHTLRNQFMEILISLILQDVRDSCQKQGLSMKPHTAKYIGATMEPFLAIFAPHGRHSTPPLIQELRYQYFLERSSEKKYGGTNPLIK